MRTSSPSRFTDVRGFVSQEKNFSFLLPDINNLKKKKKKTIVFFPSNTTTRRSRWSESQGPSVPVSTRGATRRGPDRGTGPEPQLRAPTDVRNHTKVPYVCLARRVHDPGPFGAQSRDFSTGPQHVLDRPPNLSFVMGAGVPTDARDPGCTPKRPQRVRLVVAWVWAVSVRLEWALTGRAPSVPRKTPSFVPFSESFVVLYPRATGP